MSISIETKFIGLAAFAFGIAAVALVTKVDPTTSFGALSKGFGTFVLIGNSLLFSKASYNSYRCDMGGKVKNFLSFH